MYFCDACNKNTIHGSLAPADSPHPYAVLWPDEPEQIRLQSTAEGHAHSICCTSTALHLGSPPQSRQLSERQPGLFSEHHGPKFNQGFHCRYQFALLLSSEGNGSKTGQCFYVKGISECTDPQISARPTLRK